MRILVCVKQVPNTAEIKIDPVTNALIREGVPSVVNPFDLYALELALRLREAQGGSVAVLSMGPAHAIEALRDCLAFGADEAYLVSDRKFGGSDTLATSRILADAIAFLQAGQEPFDLILCGKQAIDGDTAQVGPEIAERLGLPQVTNISDVFVEDQRLRTQRETEIGFQILQVDSPCLMTVTKIPYPNRFVQVDRWLTSRKADIPTLTSEQLMTDPSKVGFHGSPTRVKKTFVPNTKKEGVLIAGESAEESAEKLLSLLDARRAV